VSDVRDAVRLRPVTAADLDMFRRLVTEPGLIGPNYHGFTDAGAIGRRFEKDGYLGEEHTRLIVEVDGVAAGFVSRYAETMTGARYWSIGIALLPEFRGRGVGWRAQAMLVDYLFEHTPVVRIEAGTQTDNIAEQKALEKAGFRREGVQRAIEFRAGAWRDGVVYSRIRDGVTSPPVEPAPAGSAVAAGRPAAPRVEAADLRLRPLTAGDLPMVHRFYREPGLLGLDWRGFHDTGAVDRRFEKDGYLGDTNARLVVDAAGAAAGCVSWHEVRATTPGFWNIGITLLPEFRGRGIGWRAQAMLADYLFEHTPAARVEAATQPENVAEQRALEKAGFRREAVQRAIEFRAGAWRDAVLYSRIRDGLVSY
jgi:RimJ/RimL family protein N-acetyltransferase